MHTRNTEANVTVGKYLISPLTRILDNGWVASAVSIRSGTGRATTDRVLRLPRLCRDSREAIDYALAEGRRWLAASQPQAQPCLA